MKRVEHRPTISARMASDVAAALAKLAEEEGVTVSRVVERIVRLKLEELDLVARRRKSRLGE